MSGNGLHVALRQTKADAKRSLTELLSAWRLDMHVIMYH